MKKLLFGEIYLYVIEKVCFDLCSTKKFEGNYAPLVDFFALNATSIGFRSKCGRKDQNIFKAKCPIIF